MLETVQFPGTNQTPFLIWISLVEEDLSPEGVVYGESSVADGGAICRVREISEVFVDVNHAHTYSCLVLQTQEMIL
jgi:hypothetical protein